VKPEHFEMSTVRCHAVALGILIVCLAGWSMPVMGWNPADRGLYALAECNKRGIKYPKGAEECYVRGLHDYDCRQEHNPNPKDTPEACVERRTAGGPKWLDPGSVMPWKPAPASTRAPSAPAPDSDPAPQSSEPEADAADNEALDQEDAGDVASEDGGEPADGSGDEDQSADEEAGDEWAGDEEASGEEAGDEDAASEEGGDEEAADEEGGDEEAADEEAGDGEA
jgi:hypothetical protein